MGFIDSLKNKSEAERKKIAIIASSVLTLVVAIIALFSFFTNISRFGTAPTTSTEPIAIEKTGTWDEIKKTFKNIKNEATNFSIGTDDEGGKTN